MFQKYVIFLSIHWRYIYIVLNIYIYVFCLQNKIIIIWKMHRKQIVTIYIYYMVFWMLRIETSYCKNYFFLIVFVMQNSVYIYINVWYTLFFNSTDRYHRYIPFYSDYAIIYFLYTIYTILHCARNKLIINTKIKKK